MLLSVIIVNYNVKHFLEQCLCSVLKAIVYERGPQFRSLSGMVEVLVVDNNSMDGSVAFLQSVFPSVQFIVNTENTGFARANNQAVQRCKGKYILFLNPDTIIPENCFHECIEFIDDRDWVGAIGVQMLDGTGRFLPESKRGFPSPWVSFCKMTGLTGLFPNSRLFGKYYLRYLPATTAHRVDVLSGAFMWVRKEVLDRVGGFDERFFMYAEDIDLSYRIQLAGYDNYYLPNPVIIHFKGESTRRDARYVRLFYSAMIQFVEKYYKGWSARWYRTLLRMIIFLRSRGGNTAGNQTGVGNIAPVKLALVGDQASVTEMTKIASPNHEVTDTIGTPVYCEGPDFSYARIIEKLAGGDAETLTLIHGLHTQSAVGSGSKARQGVVVS